MKSLFNPNDNRELTERIKKLSNTSQAQWGKMNVNQMLAHTQSPFLCALGEMKIKRGLVGMLFGGIAKKQLMKEEPFKRNLPTAREFVITDQRDFEKEKTQLLQLVERFGQSNGKGITTDPHPFFGKMNTEEWDRLMWKHLDHHLRQFGV